MCRTDHRVQLRFRMWLATSSFPLGRALKELYWGQDVGVVRHFHYGDPSISESHPNSHADRWTLIDFQGGCLRDIGSELGAEFCHVVGEERGLVAGAGDGDVGEARVEQVRVDAGIPVNEDTFGGEALGAMTGDGVAVGEMAMLAGGELDLSVVVEAGGHAAIGRNRLDYCKVAISKA